MKKHRIYYIILILIACTQYASGQADEIIIGVDSELVNITDIVDIHLKPGEENNSTAWFDLDENGFTDIGFWVAHSFSLNGYYETRNIMVQTMDDTYFSYRLNMFFKGTCDSVYLSYDYEREMVNHYDLNDVFAVDNDTTSLHQYRTPIAELRKYIRFDPCNVHYDQPYWIGKEGYICFKKNLLNTIYLGWFKIEVLDYDEIIIKEYAVSNKKWGHGLYINEIMASNKKTITDANNEHEDWIEIYNASNESIWLGNLYLTDNLMWKEQWQMPDTTINPGGYILIWADNQIEQGKCHANFKLDKDGEAVGLYTSDLKKIDEFTYNEQTSDISIGRLPNGGNEWVYFNHPTPGESNEVLSTPERFISDKITISPNPVENSSVHLSKPCTFKIFNITGQLIDEQNNLQLINTSNFNKGMYFVVIDNGQTIKLVIQ